MNSQGFRVKSTFQTIPLPSSISAFNVLDHSLAVIRYQLPGLQGQVDIFDQSLAVTDVSFQGCRQVNMLDHSIVAIDISFQGCRQVDMLDHSLVVIDISFQGCRQVDMLDHSIAAIDISF